jgi:hypothetical protein
VEPNLISRRSLLLVLPALRLAAQSQTTFSTDVKVVNVFATVRDKKGQIVNNLNQDDFSSPRMGGRKPFDIFREKRTCH